MKNVLILFPIYLLLCTLLFFNTHHSKSPLFTIDSLASLLCKTLLGSAQFGSAYGITNGSGAVSSPEVARILSYAAENSITTVDTAQAYGNAEKVLGASTPSSDVFEFTSKLSPQSDLFFTLESIPQWEKTFFHTLDNLKVDYLHTFLFTIFLISRRTVVIIFDHGFLA